MTKAKKTRTPKTRERELTIKDAISEACGADAFEDISEPDVPTELSGDRFMVKWQERILSPSAMSRQSRSDRCSDACRTLSHVIKRLEEIMGDKTFTVEEREAASDFIDEVQNVIDEAEAVEFPGMYG